MAELNDESELTPGEIALASLEALEALLVTNMRIYDVLMMQLHATNPEQAKALEELHAKGAVVGTLPMYAGNQENE